MPKTKNTNKEIIETESTTSLFPIEVTYTDLNGKEQILHMKSEITLAEEYALLNSAVNNVVSDELGYQPMWTEYSLRCEILNYFTDYVLSDDLDENNTMLIKTNLAKVVLDKIDEKVFLKLESDFYDMVDYKKQWFSNKSEFDLLCSDVRKLVSDYASKIDDKDIKNVKKFLKNIANAKVNWETVFNTMLQKQQKSSVTNNVVNLNPKE